MIKVKLSKRLSMIADMVDNDSILADIGCDHALLDIYLTKVKKVKKTIACDITIGAINQANKNIKVYDAKNVETRLADGLKKITKEDNVDTIVLSGLGNQKIVNILKEAEDKLESVNTIIIQSNTEYNKIRKEVVKLGYKISNEVLIKDNNIIYEIIKFTKGYEKYSKKQIYFGPVILNNKNELFKELVNNEINKNNNILNKLPKSKIIKKVNLYMKNNKLKKEIRFI